MVQGIDNPTDHHFRRTHPEPGSCSILNAPSLESTFPIQLCQNSESACLTVELKGTRVAYCVRA